MKRHEQVTRPIFLVRGGTVLKGCVTAVAVLAIVSSSARVLAGQQSREDELRARAQITNFETVLTQAVQTGARNVAAQLQSANTNVDVRVETMLIGDPTVRGIRLKPHGMVFYVSVPSMNANMTLALMILSRGRTQSAGQGSTSQAPSRPPQAMTVAGSRPPGQDQVIAQVVELPSPGNVLTDPVSAYRTAVKEELVDTMIRYGATLGIKPGERLTVAARRDTPPNPRDPSDDVRTVTFTVTYDTLESVQQKKLTIQEARKLVEVDEY